MLTVVVVGVAALAVLGLRYGPQVSAWWTDRQRRRLRADPTVDPCAAHVTDEVRAALAALLEHPPEAAAGLAAALDVCRVAMPCWYWRDGLRQVVPWASEVGDGPDAVALVAELHAALGEIDVAERLLSGLPADHWRACVVRAILYDAAGDDERVEAALVAAHELAPDAEQAWLLGQLGIVL